MELRAVRLLARLTRNRAAPVSRTVAPVITRWPLAAASDNSTLFGPAAGLPLSVRSLPWSEHADTIRQRQLDALDRRYGP